MTTQSILARLIVRSADERVHEALLDALFATRRAEWYPRYPDAKCRICGGFMHTSQECVVGDI